MYYMLIKTIFHIVHEYVKGMKDNADLIDRLSDPNEITVSI